MSLLYRKGDKGQEVKRLQRALGNLTVDGKFGPKTEKALKAYQQTSQLGVDGVAGSQTRQRLALDIYPGVDVSGWNGNVRWGDVDQSHVAFVWTKISEGQDHRAKYCARNLEGCRAHEIPVGGYHFPTPQRGGSNDPKLEVQGFLSFYGGSIPPGDLLPVLDLEAGVKGDPDHNRQWALEWLQELESETGIRAVVYTARWYVNGYLKKDVGDLINYPLWIADYTKTRNEPDTLCGWKEWSAWQWTSKGKIRGLDSTGIRQVDRNWLSGGPSAFKSLTVCND